MKVITANNQSRVYLLLAILLVGLIFYKVWTISDPARGVHNNQVAVEKVAAAEVVVQVPAAKAPVASKDPEKFDVNNRGFWEGLGATKGHLFDEPLANSILEFFKKENVGSILELGAGTGTYAKLFRANGLFISCYDGNPDTQELTEGRCGVIDLSKPLDFPQHEWILSLEVGEHIPAEFENIFIQNLHKFNKKGLIISWAVEGQGGTAHVNNHNNDYIKAKFTSMGYTIDEEAEKEMRGKAFWGWFKNTVMVFRKSS